MGQSMLGNEKAELCCAMLGTSGLNKENRDGILEKNILFFFDSIKLFISIIKPSFYMCF